jgi:hypothetical protein
MRTRRRINAVAVLTAVCEVVSFWVAGFGGAQATNPTTFERSVLKGDIPQTAKDYYAAVWTSLGFFHGTDSARQMLALFDVVKQKTGVDSIINVLFLTLDSDPITPGNSFLEGLAEKIDYARNRGFLHTGEPYLSHVFDDIGILVLHALKSVAHRFRILNCHGHPALGTSEGNSAVQNLINVVVDKPDRAV